MAISRKLVTSSVTAVLGMGVAYAVAKLGLSLSVGDAALVAAIIGQLSGVIAGWIIKEVPSS